MTIKDIRSPLLDAARAGDRMALEHVLRLTQGDIRRFAQRHCMISDVDDAVQEVLLIIARKIGSLRILAAFSSWLFKTVQRECRRLGRKAFAYDPFEEDKLDQWVADHSIADLRLELYDALDALPAHYREMIVLRDFHDLAVSEIAEKLSLTPAAVKSRLHRAREQLREQLMG